MGTELILFASAHWFDKQFSFCAQIESTMRPVAWGKKLILFANANATRSQIESTMRPVAVGTELILFANAHCFLLPPRLRLQCCCCYTAPVFLLLLCCCCCCCWLLLELLLLLLILLLQEDWSVSRSQIESTMRPVAVGTELILFANAHWFDKRFSFCAQIESRKKVSRCHHEPDGALNKTEGK